MFRFLENKKKYFTKFLTETVFSICYRKFYEYRFSDEMKTSPCSASTNLKNHVQICGTNMK